MENNNYVTTLRESKSRKFWRVVLGSMLGFLLSNIIISFLGLLFMISLMAVFSSDKPVVKEQSILKLTLNKQIVERAVKTPFDDLDLGIYFGQESTIGLDDIVNAIKNAATDLNIKGISLNVQQLIALPATVAEIRDALEQFKSSGKFIYAYGDYYTQGAYYLCSVADKMYLNHNGSVALKGLSAQVIFFKGLIDKLDVDVQIVRHGQFKSAVEPFLTDKMSEANRKQFTQFTQSTWQILVNKIADSRHITTETLNNIADNLLSNLASDALALGLVDSVCYATDYEQALKQKMSIEANESLNYVSLADYTKATKKLELNPKGDIAVVYAVGDIIDGKGSHNIIGSETLCKEIRRATKNKDIKAIVLRVNSGGGSAMASDIIWNEIELAKKAGKVVITSMGDYAASGGYYISCNSDAIVAQPNTLTGSIGVFGIVPNMQKLLKNKLGITVDGVTTHKHSDMMNGFRPMDELEIKQVQASVEEVYDKFIGNVATGRKMSKAAVDSIGQGRIWSGTDALAIGLVDKLGNLDAAIALAAQKAGLTAYTVVYYPKQKEWFEELLNRNRDEEIATAIKNEFGDLYFVYQGLNRVLNQSGIQARMPVEYRMEW
ncbi:MAG: signal peptide peptidase SppA [Bacteroidales bacterium]|nr:signal peptide peptidase SppA [Bacteroidales bacterium]